MENCDELQTVPKHIAIIMDGNGRWAKQRGLPRLAGHQAGKDNILKTIDACIDYGIQYLTIYTFSTENWGRPKEEVDGLLAILESVIDGELENLMAKGVKIRHIGRLDNTSNSLHTKIKTAIEKTQYNDKITLIIAFDYGGRDEIVHAIQEIITTGIHPNDITEETVAEYLYTSGLPDPDMVIRTSGEMRLSNFLVWQAAYAELYITDTFWPDFTKEELHKALEAYCMRHRRFGGLSDEDNRAYQDEGNQRGGSD